MLAASACEGVSDASKDTPPFERRKLSATLSRCTAFGSAELRREIG